MHKYKKISLISAVGGSLLIANHVLPPYRNAWALTQDTADDLKKKRAALIPIIHHILQTELATDDSYSVEQNTLLTVTAQQGIFANDNAGTVFNFLLLDDVTNGVLTLQTDGSFTYLPDPNFIGIDTFRYSISIGSSTADEATVTIKVNGQPIAIDDDFELDGNVPFLGNVVSNAVGGDDTIVDGAEVVAVSNGATTLGGNVTIQANGNFEYTPPANLGAQQDSFVYTLQDMDGDTDTATVTWQVPPEIIGIDLVASVVEDQELNAQLTFFVPGSVEYIEFNSNRFNLAQLIAASPSSPLTAAGTLLGTFSVIGFNPTSGVLDYRYDPTGTSQDHSGASNDILRETVIIRLKDTARTNAVTGNLNIDISDTDPQANHDARSINEGGGPIAGNAVGISGSAIGDVQDTLIDSNATPVTDVDFNSTDGTVGSNLASDYGTFNINNAGVYTYTLDNTNATVQGLKSGESLAEVFTYTITDGDGDTDSANVTVTINGVEDALPNVQIPDTNGGSIGDVSVAENSTLNGNFTITATSGMAASGTALSITDEQSDTLNITLSQLQGLTSSNLSLVGADGTLTLNGYSNISTDYIISFTYDPTGSEYDHSGGDNSIIDQYTLLATDNEGDTRSDTLDILITDTNPLANDDAPSITENTSTIVGNAVSLVGADPGDVADTLIDSNASPVIDIDFGSTDGSPETSLPGSFGSLTIDAQGVYTYTLDNDNSAVQGLTSGQSLSEIFSYTITDGDGDTDSANLTVRINGVDDPVPVVTIPDTNNSAIGDASVVENMSLNGSFTITAAAGLNASGTALAITDEQSDTLSLTLSQLQNLSSANQTITATDGVLVLNGYSNTNDDHSISYSYDPTGVSRDHSGGPNSVIDQYSIVATDNESDTSISNALDILITDTTPQANDDPRFIHEGFGAIIGNAVGTIGSAPSDVQDTLIDSNATPVTDVDFGSTDGTPGSNLVSDYGTFNINSTGIYTYFLDNTQAAVQGLKAGQSLQEVFTYTITDGDGDTDSANVTVTIHGIEDFPPLITIPDNNGSGVIGDSSVAENATLSSQQFTFVATAGVASATLGGQDITNASTIPVTLVGSDGTFVINNFDSSTGVVSYSFDPTGSNRDHSAGDTSIVESASFLLIDNEGDSNSDTLDILITDTAPTTAPDTASITEDGFTNVVTGDVTTNDTSGADTAISVVGVDFGGAQTVGTPFPSSFGTLDLNSDGTYTYTLDNGNSTVDALDTGQSLTEQFNYTITDTDGDTSTASLTVTVNGVTD